MPEIIPTAVLQCETCTWWHYFWDQRPTIPFICDYCKIGEPVWGPPRKMTPEYGTPIPIVPKKKRKRKR